jgi:peptide-methionine (R)-S-oxide reductase
MTEDKKNKKVQLTEKEWREKLDAEEFEILRNKGTEPPFTGEYVDNKNDGKYVCAGCGNELFLSDTKYDSGSGWPSFLSPVSAEKIDEETDFSMGMKRTEIMCSNCGGHLGHVFTDGPKPTGLRYCVNSKSLKFKEKEK